MAKFSTDKVVKLQGKEYVLFEGLLEVAHEHCHLQSISTNLIQLPTQESPFCIVQATVTTDKGESFQGLGDASPSNVNKMIIPHMIRMAETRAVARALRFLTGFGTAFEELGDIHDTPQETNKKASTSDDKPPQAQSTTKKESYVAKAVKQVIEMDKQEAEQKPVTPVTASELKELFGDDIVVEEDDPVLTESELKRIKGKIQGCKPKEGKHYGTIYEWISEVAGFKIKTKDDLPKIKSIHYSEIASFLDKMADYFEQVAV